MTKIVTGNQTRKAIAGVMRKTKWTLNRVATTAGYPRETFAKIVDGRTETPSQDLMDAVAKLLDEVNEALS